MHLHSHYPFHRFRRQTHVTPKTYLSFLDNYKVLYTEKHDGIAVLAHRMKTGLTKLVEAQASVDVLRKELEVKEKEIAVATEAAEKVSITIAILVFNRMIYKVINRF